MANEPVLLVVDDIAEDISRSPFGERWGQQMIKLTPEHLQSLKEGRFLALDVQGEYVVYLEQAQANKGATHD